MRHERLYLEDMVEAADHIAEFIAGVNDEEFRRSELLRSAVVQKLATIGEAAARVSEELKSRHPEVPWPRIVAFRNILIHAYFGEVTAGGYHAGQHAGVERHRQPSAVSRIALCCQ
jgi:uncharacterized protein with HEPN domain